jgi:cysteine-rich repeat protein
VQRDDIVEGQDGYEACDDGNASNRDACVGTCALAACGDGFVYRGEEVCDDGNVDDGDACDGDCQGPAPAFCEDPEGGGSEQQGYQFQWDTCQIGPAYEWPVAAGVCEANNECMSNNCIIAPGGADPDTRSLDGVCRQDAECLSNNCVIEQGGNGAGLCEPTVCAAVQPTAIRYTDDSVSGPHPIGFTFLFYGVEYTEFYTTSNGTFHFTRTLNSECCSGTAIPSVGL